MKIRTGFVSNSSSTSFLIIAKEDLNQADFFELMGIEPDSPIANLFEQFYQAVIQSIDTAIDFKTVDKQVPAESLFEGEWTDYLSSHMITKIQDAKNHGLKAYLGKLSSDENLVECFFCTDSFEVENEKIYFNGLECVW